jgi:hypothetical protein
MLSLADSFSHTRALLQRIAQMATSSLQLQQRRQARRHILSVSRLKDETDSVELSTQRRANEERERGTHTRHTQPQGAGAHSPKQRRVLVQSPLALAVLHLVARPVHNGAVQCSQGDGQCVGVHSASQERHLTQRSCVIVGRLSEVGTRRRVPDETHTSPPHPSAQCAHVLTCSRKTCAEEHESVVQHQHDNLGFTHSARTQRPATASARSHGGVRPEADRTRVNRAQRGMQRQYATQTHTRTLLTHTHTHHSPTKGLVALRASDCCFLIAALDAHALWGNHRPCSTTACHLGRRPKPHFWKSSNFEAYEFHVSPFDKRKPQ